MATLAEVKEISKQTPLPSEDYVPKVMPPILGTFDMTTMYVIALFFIPNLTLTAYGGVASLTYLLLGAIIFFIPGVIATAQLGMMFPHEGSIYNWTYKALGNYWGFFIGLCYWLTGVLATVNSANAFVVTIQGLNNAWLTEPWQQGLVVLAIIGLAGVLGIQRFRTVQNTLNGGFWLTMLAVTLVAIAAVVWLATGHASMTSFNHAADWNINSGNFALFGLIALNFIGTSGPLNMGGETTERRVVTRHLLWGSVIVFACYFVGTLALLVVRGQAVLNDPFPPFEVISTVDAALGKFAGTMTAICLLSYCVWGSLFYTYAYSRLLFAGAIDKRIPANMGKLNKYRVPANAIILQAIAGGIVTIFLFIVAPYVVRVGKATDLSAEFFNVSLAALTLVWTIATAFLFVNLVGVYARDPEGFRLKRIFPMPIIWGSAAVGFIACVLTIVDTLLNSWIAQLIGNDKWWYIVGGLTVACLIVAAIASLFANSEADWEELSSK